jgi:hypothetical protein
MGQRAVCSVGHDLSLSKDGGMPYEEAARGILFRVCKVCNNFKDKMK